MAIKTTRKLRCFVASAFGHEDVDRIFDEVVIPVMCQESVVVQRVDRQEHNDDIDDRILKNLDECDFCLADLTYARPAVYFEAGIAQGQGKPVIYMARKDHLTPRSDDPPGNLRVHFDLQMKNIIDWVSPSKTLRGRLASRVRHVTKPIVRTMLEDKADSAAQASYNRTSPRARFDHARDASSKLLRESGYTLAPHSYYWGLEVLGAKETPRGHWIVAVFEQPSFSKKELGWIRNGSSLAGLSDGLRDLQVSDVRGFDALCVSLRPTPSTRVLDACPRFEVLEDGGIYVEVPSKHRSTPMAIHTLCPKSYLNLDELLAWHLERVGELRVGRTEAS